MLADSIDYYETTGKFRIVQPTVFKQIPEYEYLNEVDSLILANARLHLMAANQMFFKNLKKGVSYTKAGHPKFKKKHSGSQSYTTNNQISANGVETIPLVHKSILNTDEFEYEIVDSTDNEHVTHIRLPKVGYVKIVMHRPLPENSVYKSVTVSKTASGKYYVSLCTHFDESIPDKKLDVEKSIGLDYSVPDFFVDNQANKGTYPKFYRQFERKLAHLNKELSRRTKYSKNWYKTKHKIAVLYEKVSNMRNDWQWKKAHEISDNPDIDYVFIETLDMKEMSERTKEHKYGKSVFDAGWYSFTLKLEYLLTSLGKKIYRADKWFASSKTCSNCGNIKYDLQLKDRVYVCKKCGLVIDRDVNAAINLRNYGINHIHVLKVLEPQVLRE